MLLNHLKSCLALPDRRILLMHLVIITMSWVSVQVIGQTPDAEAQLRARLVFFWEAMQKEDYDLAAQCVHPESRQVFIHRIPKRRMETWKIQKLEFNQDRTACMVTTLVPTPVPFPGAILEWPLHHDWVLEGDQWFLKIPSDYLKNPVLSIFKGPQASAAVTPAEGQPPAVEEERLKRPPPYSLETFVADRDNPKAMHIGEKAVFRYHYRNMREKPIKIVSVHADCHCTGVSQVHPEIQPGESGVFEVALDTFGLPRGSVDKEVFVQFSDRASPVVVRLLVPIVPNFSVKPESADFGTIDKGTTAEIALQLVNESGRGVKILSWMKANPDVDVLVDKPNLAPGGTAVITLRYHAQAPGEIFDILTLRTDLEVEPLWNIRIKGTVGK